MRGASSAPTTRVIEVVELLVRSGSTRLRFVDISRELAINQATVHSILKTLCDKGWVTRDPDDKSFSVGPALAAMATRADLTRPVAHAARKAVVELAHQTGYPASVIERVGAALLITAFEGADTPHPAGVVGDKIPFVPPFGVAIAAWDPTEEQRAWVERVPSATATVKARLHELLSHTRNRGFDIDRMTPTLSHAAQAIATLNSSAVPEHIRQTLEQLRGEFTTLGYSTDNATDWRSQPIATISAPVMDRYGRPALMIGVHPMCVLSPRQAGVLGRRLMRLTKSLDDTNSNC